MAAKTQFGDEAEAVSSPGKTMFGDDAEDGANPAASPTYAPPVPKPALPASLRTGGDYTNQYGDHMPGPDSPVKGSPVMPLAAGSIGPIRMLVGALGAMGGEQGAGALAQHFHAPPIVENGARLAGGTLGGLVGGAVGESPKIQGAAKGAVRGIPKAIEESPRLATMLGLGGGASIPSLITSGHPAMAALDAGLTLSPFMAKGAMAGAKGKPMAGPVMRSLFSDEAQPTNPRTPIWAGVPEAQDQSFPPVDPIRNLVVDPGTRRLRMDTRTPSGRTTGGPQNIPGPTPPSPPRTPMWAEIPETQNSSFAPIVPIRGPLPSGRIVGGPQNITPGQFAPSAESKIIAPSLENTIQAGPSGIANPPDYSDTLQRSIEMVRANRNARGLPPVESRTDTPAPLRRFKPETTRR